MAYIDLVLVDHDPQYVIQQGIYEAPAWCNLKPGDKVLVCTEFGKSDGTVRRVVTVEPGDDEYEFITAINGLTNPLKRVIAKQILQEFDYDDVE